MSLESRTPQFAMRFGDWCEASGKLIYSDKVIAVDSFEDASRKWSEIRDITIWERVKVRSCRC